jgi:DsbC/DsbD-like thiol-disulfide interchange protein
MHIPLHTTKSMICSMMVLAGASTAEVQPDFGERHLSATLRSSHQTLSAGDQFFLALDLNIDEGWHTYWDGMSDTGYAPTINFETNTESLSFGAPVWPTPERYIAPGSILDHIYEDKITVLIPVKVEQAGSAPLHTVITASVEYLICKEYCLPESVKATTAIAVASMTDPKPDQSILSIAKELPKDLIDYDIQWSSKQATLIIPGATHYRFFPNDECTQPAELIKQGDVESDSLTITFDRSYDEPSDPIRLSGRLSIRTSGEWRHYNIDTEHQP